MVTKRELEEFIKKLPPKPDIVIRTLEEVKNRDLKKASQIASTDPVLVKYLRNLINRPIFGLRNKVTDIGQIFTLLGTDAVYELLHHYLLSLVVPKEWRIFNLDTNSFGDLQANLSYYWNRVLEFENVKDKDVSIAISLLPLSIIVCDEIFHKYQNEIQILQGNSLIDYDFLLFQLTGTHLNTFTAQVGEYWEFPKKALDIVKASNSECSEKFDETTIRFGKWMHLVLFYVLSKPQFIQANLNSFIKFDVDYISSIYEEFEKIVGEELS